MVFKTVGIRKQSAVIYERWETSEVSPVIVPGYRPGVNPRLQHRERGPRSLVNSLIGGDGAEGAGRLQLIELHQVRLQYWQSSHQHMRVRQLPGEVRGTPRGLWGIEHGAYTVMTIVSVPTRQPGKLTAQKALSLLL